MDARAVPSAQHIYIIFIIFCFNFLRIIIQLLIIRIATSSLLDWYD